MDYYNLTEEKAKKVGLQIVKNISSTVPKYKDLQCYKFFQGLYNEDDFSYLMKVTDKNDNGETVSYALPAKMRFIPIIRPKINKLLSTYVISPLAYKVYAVDQVSLKKKLNKKVQKYMMETEMMIQNTLVNLQMGKDQIIQKQQQLQQLMQREPQSQEEAQQIQMLQQQIPMIEAEMKKASMIFDKGLQLTEEEIERIERQAEYEADEIFEILAQKILNKALDSEGIFVQTKNGMTDKFVTGKVQYLVIKEKNIKKPVFKNVNSLTCFYSADDDVENIEDTRWVAIKTKMSAAQILNEYRFDRISIELRKKLMSNKTPTSSDLSGFIPAEPSKAIDAGLTTNQVNGYAGTSIDLSYDVYRIFLRGQRSVNIKKIPNKYMPGKVYRKFISDEEAEAWNTNKPANESKGETLSHYPMEDIWDIIIIDNNEPVRYEKLSYQGRDENYQVKLPVIGEAFNNLYKAPYSLIWSTKDIQIMYNLVNYHEELMLALAGMKGSYMDDSYRPQGMGRKEWMYLKKLGTAWIDGGKLPGQGRRPSNFAHWGANYDDSVSPSIQYLALMKRNLEETASIVTGVTRESMGQTIPSDQVGTYEMSNRNASLITHILFWEHDQILKRALAAYINLCILSQNEDSYLSLVNQELEQEIFPITAKLFEGVRLDVFLKNSNEEYQQVQALRSIIGQGWAKGQLPIEALPISMTLTSVKEMEVRLNQMADRARKIQQLNAEGSERARAQAEIEIKRYDNEYKKIMEDEKNKLEQSKLQIEGIRLQMEMAKIKADQEIKNRDIDSKLVDTASEREIEIAMLEESNRSNVANEKLKELELKLNAILNAMQSNDSRELGIKKIEVEKTKAKNVGKKEHVNNN